MPTVIDGTTGVSQIQAGATSGGLPVFQCRAWVNFDGTRDTTGAVSTANTPRLIRGSGNVSSVVRNGAGDYTVNFTTAMPDANYAVAATNNNSTGNAPITFSTSQNTGSAVVRVIRGSGAFDDVSGVFVAVLR